MIARAALSVLLLLGACQGVQVVDEEQATAAAVALRRGRYEMACPAATSAVLSSQLLRANAWRGLERSEYVVAVTGCGRQAIYVSVCQVGSLTCLAARPPVPPAPRPPPPQPQPPPQ